MNIPIVLDSIFSQTVLPDRVVLNLAHEEEIPPAVEDYLALHSIEVYRTEDTKVYKKFLPTLTRYPDATVINIDDDILYPPAMIEDFLIQHEKYPDNPICGNHTVFNGLMCHCGEASLTKYEYFGEYLKCIDSELMSKCSSSDIVYTYFATKNGHPYIPSTGYYGTEYNRSFNPRGSWTKNRIGEDGIGKSYDFLVEKYGEPTSPIVCYLKEDKNAFAVKELISGIEKEARESGEAKVRQTLSYKIGFVILAPARMILSLLNRLFK